MDKKEGSYTTAAERVKYLILKGRLGELWSLLLTSRPTQPLKCNYLKVPKIPKKISPPPGKKEKAENSSHSYKALPQNGFSLSIEGAHTFKREELAPHRVHSWKLKEYRLAARKFKNHEEARHVPRKRQVSLLAKVSDDISKEQQQYWEDFIKAKEERHFQIGRVIKYPCH